jgi:hypothetical protein
MSAKTKVTKPKTVTALKQELETYNQRAAGAF